MISQALRATKRATGTTHALLCTWYGYEYDVLVPGVGMRVLVRVYTRGSQLFLYFFYYIYEVLLLARVRIETTVEVGSGQYRLAAITAAVLVVKRDARIYDQRDKTTIFFSSRDKL